MIRVELLDASGAVVTTTEHASPLLVGSSEMAALRLHGAGVAPEHMEASLSASGGFALRQLDDRHPTLVGALQLSEAETASPVTLQCGDVRLRLSRTDEPAVAPTPAEDASPPRARAWAMFATMVGLLGVYAYLIDYTDSPAEEAAYLTLGVAMFALPWAGAWAVGNRLFGHPLAFARHLQVTVFAVLSGVVLGSVEGAFLASIHVHGLDALLNWTVWGVWAIAVLSAHMAIAGSWSRTRRWIVSGTIYYAIFAAVSLAPTDATPAEHVQLSMHGLGYLPEALYLGSDPETLLDDATALIEAVDDLPAGREVGGGSP